MKEYIVFRCTKCTQYTYAKTEQKGKKCPRCGRMHKVSDVQGVTVDGCTSAMKKIKELQSAEYKNARAFKSTQPVISFHKPTNLKIESKKAGSSDQIVDQSSPQDVLFQELLHKIYAFQQNEGVTPNQGFPQYILDLILDEITNTEKTRLKLYRKLKKSEKFTRKPLDHVYISI